MSHIACEEKSFLSFRTNDDDKEEFNKNNQYSPVIEPNNRLILRTLSFPLIEIPLELISTRLNEQLALWSPILDVSSKSQLLIKFVFTRNFNRWMTYRMLPIWYSPPKSAVEPTSTHPMSPNTNIAERILWFRFFQLPILLK